MGYLKADTWRSGGGEIGNDMLTSFDFMDEIIRRVARKDVFPNLKTIVVAGHSAGGQFVIRYEISNQVHDSVGVPISYIVSNPSSFAYVDTLRPTASALPPTFTASAPGYHPPAAPSFCPICRREQLRGYPSIRKPGQNTQNY
jgi:hypothetical protein